MPTSPQPLAMAPQDPQAVPRHRNQIPTSRWPCASRLARGRTASPRGCVPSAIFDRRRRTRRTPGRHRGRQEGRQGRGERRVNTRRRCWRCIVCQGEVPPLGANAPDEQLEGAGEHVLPPVLDIAPLVVGLTRGEWTTRPLAEGMSRRVGGWKTACGTLWSRRLTATALVSKGVYLETVGST